MYLRRNKKRSDGEDYFYWTLVESQRTMRGPRQRIVATLGKLPGLDVEERMGWEEIVRVIDDKPRSQKGLFDEESKEPPTWATININQVKVERLRHFGDVYLGLHLWSKLGLMGFCREHFVEGREGISWGLMVCILVLGRFCAPSSELQIAESWYGKTALEDILGIKPEKVNRDRLYRGLDELLPYKDKLCQHLQNRYGYLFGLTFDFLIYDITSTYFEGSGKWNEQAKRGYSRDGRPDCVQVCIGLVTSKEGLPLAYEIFDGNRVDVTTVQEMILTMESKYGKANRIWVMDRGMISEQNVAYLNEKGARYVVGSPKSELKKYEQALLDRDWEEVEPGVEVKLCPSQENPKEMYVLCRSERRKEKENAILNRFVNNMEKGLAKMAVQMESGRLRNKQQAERKIGRLQERNKRAASLFRVTVMETGENKLRLDIYKDEGRYGQLMKQGGSYILRTNWMGVDAATVWKTYVQLTEVEEAFRIAKHDLGMRPIYHQRTDRTQAHILVCFLALAMRRTLQQWMKAAGLGTAPRKLMEELREIKSLDVLLPTRDKLIRLRLVSSASKELKVLLQRLNITLPNTPKIIENVVEKTA